MKIKRIHIFMLILFITFSAGCKENPAVIPIDEPSPFPTLQVTNTPVPTASPTIQPTAVPIKIIFDGMGCNGHLPKELPLGDHSFDLLDKTDLNAELWLVRLTNDKTYQDLLDLQSEPGEWDPKPRWAVYDTDLLRESQEADGGRLERTSWRFYLMGEHIVYCYTPSPQMIYYAGPISIVEAIEN